MPCTCVRIRSFMIEFNARYVLAVRRKALRSGVWFRVLDRVERSILSLVPRCVDRVRSPEMIDIVAKIIVKVKEALMSPLERFRSQVAKSLALKISLLARGWGNRSAEEWAEDKSFIQYLSVNKFNDITIFRAG